jgi:hypothetical protein
MTENLNSSSGRRSLAGVVAGAALLAGCTEMPPTDAAEPAPAYTLESGGAPTPLVSVAIGGEPRTLWPFTGTVPTADADAWDPINLIFLGHADPLSIRAALLALDGNRPAFPPLPFFQCTWRDAMGGNQATYVAAAGWSGSAIQLECGSYEGLRFHLRLFRHGDWTVANAHFETIVPGTHEHQVLNWELAEQFVTADIARAGLLAAPPAVTEPLNPHPFFRTIHPMIYTNDALVPLHPIIDAVVVDARTIGIRTNGRATVLTLGRTVPAVPGSSRQELVIQFNQVIPKPFCGGPADFVHVQGPLLLRQDVNVAGSGLLTRAFHASGELVVTPVNPMTGQVIGPPGRGLINGLYRGMASGAVHSASSLLNQQLLRDDLPPQRLMVDMQVGPHGATRYRNQQECRD